MHKHPVFAKRDSKATLNSLPHIGFSHTAFRSQRGGGRKRRERDSLSLFPLLSWGQKEEEEEGLSDVNEGWDSPNDLRKIKSALLFGFQSDAFLPFLCQNHDLFWPRLSCGTRKPYTVRGLAKHRKATRGRKKSYK